MWPSISRLKYFAKTSVIATSLCIGISLVIFFLFVKICLFSKSYSNCRNNLISKKSEKIDPVIKFDQTYTNRDIVNCLDTLLTKHKNNKLHIAFIGDSLVRNQFVNFLKLIPEYDRKVTRDVPSWGIENFHDDRNATHRLLNEFQVSFLWRPVIDENFLDEFKKWEVAKDDEAPFITFLGVSVHHMLGEHKNNRSFEQILEKDLLPVLGSYLTAHPLRQLVWLIQTPSLDKHVSLPREIHQYPEVHFDSIHHYNKIARRIFKKARMQINLFNLFDSFVNEYIRGCAYQGYQRRDPENFVHCNDLLHPGFGATFSFSTQLLFNHICK